MEGRYCWWHEQVLKSVAEAISRAMTNNKHGCHQRATTAQAGIWICFRQGASSRSWKVAQAPSPALRTDMVLTSATWKQVLLIELTVL